MADEMNTPARRTVKKVDPTSAACKAKPPLTQKQKVRRLGKTERAELKAMFDGRCAYCGHPLGDRWHADHVKAVRRTLTYVRGKGIVRTGEVRRPSHDCIDNLMPACPPCNIDKHARTLEQWRTKLQDAPGVLARNQPTYRHAVRFGLVQETHAKVVFYFESQDAMKEKAPP